MVFCDSPIVLFPVPCFLSSSFLCSVPATFVYDSRFLFPVSCFTLPTCPVFRSVSHHRKRCADPAAVPPGAMMGTAGICAKCWNCFRPNERITGDMRTRTHTHACARMRLRTCARRARARTCARVRAHTHAKDK